MQVVCYSFTDFSHNIFRTMSAAGSKGLGALLKQGWNEIPEILGSTFMAVIGVGLGVAGLKRYYDRDLNNRRYKTQYTVIRHDDPRAEKVRKD